MDHLILLFEQPVVQRFGLVLLHFVWQGVWVAFSLACGLRFLRQKSADARYGLAVAALALMVAFPIGTFFLVSAPGGARSTAVQADLPALEPEPAPLAEQLPPIVGDREPPASHDSLEKGSVLASLPAAPSAEVPQRETAERADPPPVPLSASAWGHLPKSMLPWVVSLWTLGVLVLSLRLAGSWFLATRLKRRGTQPVAKSLQQVARRLAQQLGVRRSVAILESTCVTVPCLIGVLRPCILLPASALTGLTPEHLEAILAHELAHVRRHDCLVTVIQAFVETLLFYHPGVWWVSRQIRIERENCCDDIALAIIKGRLLYASALADVAQLAARHNRLTAAASGADLLCRIRRILKAPSAAPKHSTSWSAGVMILVILTSLAAAWGFDSMVRLARADEQERSASDGNSPESNTQPVRDAAEDGQPFRIVDNFDGKLALDWEVLRPNPTHASLEKNPGKLTITSQFGGFHGDASDTRGTHPGNNQYMIPVPQDGGDFVVTTCLEDFHPTARYQQAGPVVYDDHDNYFKALVGVGRSNVIIGSSWEERSYLEGKDVPTRNMQWDRTWLRIIKRGNAYEALYSLDGKEYTQINEHVWGDGSPQRIGLFATNDNGTSEPVDAVFDFIEVRSLTAEERNDPAQRERQKFFGAWELAAKPGSRKLTDSLPFTQFTFNGASAAIVERQEAMHLDFSVQPEANPRTFSLSLGDRDEINASYRFEGDQLVVCMSTLLNAPAPASFEPGPDRKLLRLQRMAAAKARAIQYNGHATYKQFQVLDPDVSESLTLDEFVADRPSPESIRQAKELFAILDRDNNGKIAYTEFEVYPRKATHLRYDLDADGTLSEEEFALGEMKSASRDRALDLFRLIDRDGNGRLDLEEFMDRSAEAWFVSFDANEDKRVSYDEYAKGNPSLAKTPRCRTVFDAIDADSSGSLSRDEYVGKAPKYALSRLEAPGDSDGKVSINDFLFLE